jgi:sortase A
LGGTDLGSATSEVDTNRTTPRGRQRRARAGKERDNHALVNRLRAALSAIGTVLTSAGVLILLFVAYQLWGTGLYTARAQTDLKAEFRTQTAVREPAPTTTTTASPAPTAPPPTPGQAIAVIRIPKIGVDQVVVEGVSQTDLRKGPGHYPSTPMPGETGNAAIAGHRTTYGAPFNRLDELQIGDEIEVTTVAGRSTYRVMEKKVVRPDQVEVLDPTADARLTLTTCHPKYSAAQRLVVVGTLDPDELPVRSRPAPVPAASEAEPPPELADAGLSSDRSKLPTAGWGVTTAMVGAVWWRIGRRRRHWTTLLLGAVPFLVVLFMFYANLELLLPANF